MDFQGEHGDFWVKELKGLGAAKAATISDAADAYWARNLQPADEPETEAESDTPD